MTAIQDLLVANDIGLNDFYRNDGNLQFENVAVENGTACDIEGRYQACMGVATGDVDNDGDLDLMVTNYGGEYHTLYRNEGDGFFSDVTQEAGLVSQTTLDTVGWGVGLHDLDLDGNLDIFSVNGHVITDMVLFWMRWRGKDTETYLADHPQMKQDVYNLGADQPKHLFLGRGDGSFVDASDQAGDNILGPRMSRGAAFADFDRDGRIDVAASNKNQLAQVLLNRMPRKGRCVEIALRGKAPNTFAVGARVRVTAGERTFTRTVDAGTSYASSSDYVVHVGLGAATRIDRVVVRWPDGTETSYENLPVDTLYRLVQGVSEVTSEPLAVTSDDPPVAE